MNALHDERDGLAVGGQGRKQLLLAPALKFPYNT
jgi:hypothetical protein